MNWLIVGCTVPCLTSLLLLAPAAQTPTTFFTDEWRCPVLVHDVVRVCEALISKRDELQHRCGKLPLLCYSATLLLCYSATLLLCCGCPTVIPQPTHLACPPTHTLLACSPLQAVQHGRPAAAEPR